MSCASCSDQCSRGLASLRDLNAARDVVLLAEVTEERTYVRHHKQKIVLVLSAMRHFAGELEARGVRVDYVRLDDPANTGSFGAASSPAPRRGMRRTASSAPCPANGASGTCGMVAAASGIPVEIRDDDRFFCTLGCFAPLGGER